MNLLHLQPSRGDNVSNFNDQVRQPPRKNRRGKPSYCSPGIAFHYSIWDIQRIKNISAFRKALTLWVFIFLNYPLLSLFYFDLNANFSCPSKLIKYPFPPPLFPISYTVVHFVLSFSHVFHHNPSHYIVFLKPFYIPYFFPILFLMKKKQYTFINEKIYKEKRGGQHLRCMPCHKIKRWNKKTVKTKWYTYPPKSDLKTFYHSFPLKSCNWIWDTIPTVILWTLCKERNLRIF